MFGSIKKNIFENVQYVKQNNRISHVIENNKLDVNYFTTIVNINLQCWVPFLWGIWRILDQKAEI